MKATKHDMNISKVGKEKRIAFRVPKPLHDLLHVLAEKNKTTISELARQSLIQQLLDDSQTELNFKR